MINKGEKIGAMDRAITIQVVSEAVNEYAEQEETWSDVKQVFAAISYPDTHTGEDVDTGLNIAHTRVNFTIRADSTLSLNEKNRIMYDGKVHDIVGIKELDRGAYLGIMANRFF